MVAAAGIAAAGISAAGSVGAAALSKSGGGGGIGLKGLNYDIRTPGYDIFLRDNQGAGAPGARLAPNMTPARSALGERFPRALGDLDTLRNAVRPGFSAFRQAGVNAIANQRESAIGDLKATLNRRKVLGSSFANDAKEVLGR